MVNLVSDKKNFKFATFIKYFREDGPFFIIVAIKPFNP